MFLFIISKETSLLINIISFFSYISIGDLMEEFRKVMDTEYYTPNILQFSSLQDMLSNQ